MKSQVTGKEVVLSVLHAVLHVIHIPSRKENRYQGGLNEKDNETCLKYFPYQHLMNSYIYLLIVNCVKLEERFVIYIKCIASVTSISFQKIF